MIREDPRVKIAVPICSLPSDALGKHLLWRADKLPDNTTHLPTAVREYFGSRAAPGTYRGKKILALHGGLDAMLPWKNGAEEWEKVVSEAGPGEAERWIDEGYGHVVSQEMVRRTAEWLWRWGLSAA